MKFLVTGSAGQIGSYVVKELLSQGHEVIGLDNLSKYGRVKKSFDSHPNFHFVKGDAKNVTLLKALLRNCDYLIALAAKTGGIKYFHQFAYDLMSENERVNAGTFDAAVYAHKNFKLRKITVISSSMVYENASTFPTPETEMGKIPAPKTIYGFQKLAGEYHAKAAWEQYRLPYTIVRLFNCVGIFDGKVLAGKPGVNHVVPDLVAKALKRGRSITLFGNGQQIRSFTHGSDLARGIVLATVSPKAKNKTFNIANSRPVKILDLAKLIWEKTNPDKEFRWKSAPALANDVAVSIADTRPAKEILGFEADVSIKEMVDEIIAQFQSQQ